MVWQWLPLLRVALLPRLLRWLTPGGGFVKAEKQYWRSDSCSRGPLVVVGLLSVVCYPAPPLVSPLPIDSPPLSPLRRGIGSGRAGWPLRGALSVSARVGFACGDPSGSLVYCF